MNQQINRTILKPDKINVLMLLYKFRFMSGVQISKYRQNSRYDSSSSILNWLYRNGYINKVYDKHFRLIGKSAYYTLLSAGVKQIKHQLKVDQKAVHNMQHNLKLTQPNVEHYLNVVDIYLNLRQKLNAKYDIYAKNELITYNHFPKNKPDLYLRSKKTDFILDNITDKSFFKVKLRISELYHHYDYANLLLTSYGSYPIILLVTRNKYQLKQITKYASSYLENLGITSEINICLTTTENILSTESNIWINVNNPSQSFDVFNYRSVW